MKTIYCRFEEEQAYSLYATLVNGQCVREPVMRDVMVSSAFYAVCLRSAFSTDYTWSNEAMRAWLSSLRRSPLACFSRLADQNSIGVKYRRFAAGDASLFR